MSDFDPLKPQTAGEDGLDRSDLNVDQLSALELEGLARALLDLIKEELRIERERMA